MTDTGDSLMIQVSINGEQKEVAEHLNLSQLLAQLELNPMYLAVEVNRVLIPRKQHAEYQLQPNDQLEIVTLVGGG